MFSEVSSYQTFLFFLGGGEGVLTLSPPQYQASLSFLVLILCKVDVSMFCIVKVPSFRVDVLQSEGASL